MLTSCPSFVFIQSMNTGRKKKQSLFDCYKFRGRLLTQHQEHPPQPVLSVKVTREVCGELGDKQKDSDDVTQMSPAFYNSIWRAALFYSANKPTTTKKTFKHQIGIQDFWVLCAYIEPHLIFLCVMSGSVDSLTHPDYENPFDEGEAEAWDSPIAPGCWGGQTERQEEANPVEQECHWAKNGGRGGVRHVFR